MKPEILILGGPTAIGKTKLSVNLAKELNAEIISCDSMQIYKYMDIGSAKVMPKEMNDVRHHLIDFVDPREPYSVAQYKEDCLREITDISSRGKRVLMTGGTGLYIDSIIKNLSFTASCRNDEIRDELEKFALEHGKEKLFEILKETDPKSAEIIHPNNVKRVIRAIEVSRITGQPFSSFKQEEELNEDFIIHYYFLNMDRERLYERINERVEIMFENGLINEVKDLLAMGLKRENQSMQGIGYKEVIDYIDQKYSIEVCKDKIKQNSRNYAKRQLTWFRNEKFAKEINRDNLTDVEIIRSVADRITN